MISGFEDQKDEELSDCEFPQIINNSSSGIRTFFVFLDLPQHFEFRVGELPLISKGTEMELDMNLRNPRNPRKIRKINGSYTVARRILKYSTTQPKILGVSQYLELIPSEISK